MTALQNHPPHPFQPSDPSNDGLELAQQAASGNRDAFTKIYNLHINRVYGLSLRLTTDTIKAETLTQDVFIKAWSSLGSFSGSGPLSAWLARLTVNLWRDQYRHNMRQQKLLKEAALSWENDRPTNGSVIPLLTAMDLEKSLKKLPKGARTVFTLHEIEGYKHHEIAEMMNTTTGTVKSQLHRARKLLRVLLSSDKTGTQEA